MGRLSLVFVLDYVHWEHLKHAHKIRVTGSSRQLFTFQGVFYVDFVKHVASGIVWPSLIKRLPFQKISVTSQLLGEGVHIFSLHGYCKLAPLNLCPYAHTQSWKNCIHCSPRQWYDHAAGYLDPQFLNQGRAARPISQSQLASNFMEVWVILFCLQKSNLIWNFLNLSRQHGLFAAWKKEISGAEIREGFKEMSVF